MITTAKELAKLVSAKDKACYRLNRATTTDPAANRRKIQPRDTGQPSVDHPPDQSKPPLQPANKSQPLNAESRCKSQPPKQPQDAAKRKVSQPLKIGVKRQPLALKRQPPAAKRQPQKPKRQPQWQQQFQKWPPAARKWPQNVARVQPKKQPLMQPLDRHKKQRLVQPQVAEAPDLPPDPDPEPKSSVSIEDWSKGSIDPG